MCLEGPGSMEPKFDCGANISITSEEDALSACGLDGDFYAHRVREKDEAIPLGSTKRRGQSGIPVAGAGALLPVCHHSRLPVTLLGLWGQQNADRR